MKWGMDALVSHGVALSRDPKRGAILSLLLNSSSHISWTARWWIFYRCPRCVVAIKSSCRIEFVRCCGGGRKALINVGCFPGNRQPNRRWEKNTPCTGHRSTEMQCRCPMNSRQRAPGVELLLCMAQCRCSCRHSDLTTTTYPDVQGRWFLVHERKIPRVAPSEAFARICHCFFLLPITTDEWWRRLGSG